MGGTPHGRRVTIAEAASREGKSTPQGPSRRVRMPSEYTSSTRSVNKGKEKGRSDVPRPTLFASLSSLVLGDADAGVSLGSGEVRSGVGARAAAEDVSVCPAREGVVAQLTTKAVVAALAT